jgi:hypothetical protein
MADKCQITGKTSFGHIDRKALRRSALIVVLAVWGALYLPNLSNCPRWYGDETITLGCGQDLVKGLFANRAVWNTYINPQFCYQPGYVFLVGLASTLSDREIGWPRLLNSLTALGIAWTCLRLLGRRIGISRALLIALLFLTYQQSVIHFRWVYAHNLTAFGLFVCFSTQCLRRNSTRSWQGGGGLAIAAAAHPLALHGGVAAFLNRWNQPKAWIPTLLPPLVVGLVCLIPIWLWNIDWWWNDFQALRDFYAGYTRELGAGWQWPVNFLRFLSHDWLHVLGGVALIPCLFTSLRPIAVASLVLVALLTQNRQNLPVFYYQAVVVLPLLVACLGWGLFWLQRRFFRRWNWTRWALFLLPLFMFMHVAPQVWSAGLISRNNPWVVRSNQDHLRASQWLNQNTRPEDLVICHWNIGWLLRCRTADPMMSVAWEGMTTFTYEKGLLRQRFRYPAGLREAKYFVLTDIDRIWTLGQPNVSALFNEQTLSVWRPVFQNGSVLVLARPDFLPPAQ